MTELSHRVGRVSAPFEAVGLELGLAAAASSPSGEHIYDSGLFIDPEIQLDPGFGQHQPTNRTVLLVLVGSGKSWGRLEEFLSFTQFGFEELWRLVSMLAPPFVDSFDLAVSSSGESYFHLCCSECFKHFSELDNIAGLNICKAFVDSAVELGLFLVAHVVVGVFDVQNNLSLGTFRQLDGLIENNLTVDHMGFEGLHRTQSSSQGWLSPHLAHLAVGGWLPQAAGNVGC